MTVYSDFIYVYSGLQWVDFGILFSIPRHLFGNRTVNDIVLFYFF